MTEEDTTQNFSPLESMILEVLVARHRLGEPFWPFETNSHITKALNVLERSGMIQTMGGHVEKTRRAGLTGLAKELLLDSKYQSPIDRASGKVEKLDSLIKEVDALRGAVAGLSRSW